MGRAGIHFPAHVQRSKMQLIMKAFCTLRAREAMMWCVKETAGSHSHALRGGRQDSEFLRVERRIG